MPMPAGLFDLTGQTALVTGSSRGLGRAMAEGLADAGAAVVLNGADPGRLAAAAGEMRGRGRAVHEACFDVTNEAAVLNAFERLDGEGIAVDILVNNAGIQWRQPMVDLATADWRRVIETNLTSAFVIGREAARRMIPRGRGKVVNIGSLTGRALHGGEGRHQDADPRHGGGMGAARHPGQRHRAGLHADGHEPGPGR